MGGRAPSSAVNISSSAATAVSSSLPEIFQSTLVRLIAPVKQPMDLRSCHCAVHPVHATKASNPADLNPLLPNVAVFSSNVANSSSVMQEARPQTGAQA